MNIEFRTLGVVSCFYVTKTFKKYLLYDQKLDIISRCYSSKKLHFSMSSKTYGQGHIVIMIIMTSVLITLLMHLLIASCKIII